ncbi:MAG: DUF4097 family beta strand repeat-containing protein [Egibacteraceae bacterium]
MSGVREVTLAVGSAPEVELSLPSGTARVLPSEDGAVAVTVRGRNADDFHVEQSGDRVMLRPIRSGLRWDRYDVTVRVPHGTRLEARVAAADVEVQATLSALQAEFASGDLVAGGVTGDVTARSASGDLRLGTVAGRLDATTASGDVEVATVERDASVRTASGDVRLGTARNRVHVRTASGDVAIRDFCGDQLSCATMSGDILVGLPPGRTLDVDLHTLSGSIRNDFDVAGNGGGEARLELRSVSGTIRLEPRRG